MEVKWMSRNLHSDWVGFWCSAEPALKNGSFIGGAGWDFSLPVWVVRNAPEPGTCVPVESFKPIEVTVKQEPKVTIRCETFATRLYSVYKGDRLVIGNITEELAILIHPNCVTLTAGCSCEIPPR